MANRGFSDRRLPSVLINVYSTVYKVPELRFPHDLHARRDRTDPELASHLEEFMGYVVSAGDGGMSQVKYHVMRHLRRVRHHLSLTVSDGNLDAFSAWARSANAMCFTPDGSIRDPAGRTLIARDGSSDGEADVPYPADALVRKRRHETQLAELDVAIPASLPPVVGETEVELREAVDVIKRASALFIVALRAESLAIGDEIRLAQLRARYAAGFEALSPGETAFVNASSPTSEQVVTFTWRYEALAVLQWALGLAPTLPFPATICDVGSTARIMLDADADALAATARLRPAASILDALDLHYRLHWAARQASLDGRELAADVDTGVIQERHTALNWLARFEDADWDDVDTPT